MSGLAIKRSCFAERTRGTFAVLVERVEEVEIEAMKGEGRLDVFGAVRKSAVKLATFLLLELSMKRESVDKDRGAKEGGGEKQGRGHTPGLTALL